MPTYSRYVLTFVAGLVCGGALVKTINPTNDTTVMVVPASERNDSSIDVQRELDVAATMPEELLSTTTPAPAPNLVQDAPEIPELYRETIGPVVAHISFGQRYQEFEAEPIDVPWAYAMETGINDFIAIHGPKSGEVFEFVQCRSSNCVLAGYTIHGYESQGASVIGDLVRQPWWQGGRSASSTHDSREGRISFVTLFPRFDDSPGM